MSYIEMMNELVSLGTPLRNIIVNYIIDEEYYLRKIRSETLSSLSYPSESSNSLRQKITPKETSVEEQTEVQPKVQRNQQLDLMVYGGVSAESTVENNSEDRKDGEDDILSSQNASFNHSVYQKALSIHEPVKVPRVFAHIADRICALTKNKLVDELLFWCIRFEFPEPLVKFLVSLLPDQRYKMHFARSFVAQYSYISVLLLQSRSEHICSRVVHISVQLFSNEATALKALDEYYLLPILLSTLHNMLVTSGIQSEETRENLLIP